MAGLAPTRELAGAAAAAAGATRSGRLYDKDFWSWTQEQAAALRRRDLDAVDWENVIEEIETLGRSEQHAWTSHCKNVIVHLLKMEHSPREGHLSHWRKEIVTWRNRMADQLQDNPGMKGRLREMLALAWSRGRRDGIEKLVEHAGPRGWAAEKALRRSWDRELPEECPYALEDIAGYDPDPRRYSRRDTEPQPDSGVWPAAVARRMNEELGEDYPVRHRAPSRGAGPSR
ncbi:MAG: DUF29 domain-containing protein [Bryobacterales bacterium]|nr:DUF29 domain-containing protein [Bryobacterales bacterium]